MSDYNARYESEHGGRYCTMCGAPQGDEIHHDDHRRAENGIGNLRSVCRRCHMKHHGNRRAVDNQAEQRYGPTTPSNLGP